MGSSTLNIVRESRRQKRTQDDKFFKNLLYLFELRVPQDLAQGTQSSFLFPLVLNPESYVLEEPFAVEVTPTHGGHLVVEENGIVQRNIKLRGHTGFKPRKLLRAPVALNLVEPAERSYARSLKADVYDAVSGQRHFQYLQDAVFRTYADLKRSPAHAKDTKLVLHIAKDDERWVVVPKRFVLERHASKPTLYQYSIDLLATHKASAAIDYPSKDRGLLEQIRDVLRMIKSGVDMVKGAIQDLSRYVSKVRGLIANIDSIISTASQIVDAALDFVRGASDLIQVPRKLLANVVDAIEKDRERLENLSIKRFLRGDVDVGADSGNSPSDLSPDALNSLNRLADGLDRIGLHSHVFETPAQAEARKNREMQQVAVGDIAAIDGASEYPGVRPHTLAQGDTLASLAATHLGDARKWQDIAILNDMGPPFALADGGKEAGRFAVGGTILLPSFTKPFESSSDSPVLGVPIEASAEEHLLGADFAVEVVPGTRPQVDLVIDDEHGGADVRLGTGRDNLSQALTLRLMTERGSYILYKQVGVDRIVGVGSSAVDAEMAKFRVVQALESDPRIARVSNITFERAEHAPDAIVIEADAEVSGFGERISVEVPVQ